MSIVQARSIQAHLAGGILRWSWGLMALTFLCSHAEAQPLGTGVPGSWMSTAADGPPASGLQPSAWRDRYGFGWSLGGNLALDLAGNHTLAREGEDASRAVVLELGAFGARTPAQATQVRASAFSAPNSSHETDAWAVARVIGFRRGSNPRNAALARGGDLVGARAVHLHDARGASLAALHASEPEPAPEPFHSDTSVAGVDPARPGEDIRFLTGAETSVTWALDRLVLQSRVGIAVGMNNRPARWGELHTSYWARPGLGFFARLRATTEAPAAIEAVRETQAALGVQLAMGGFPGIRRARPVEQKHGFRMESLGGSRYRLTLTVPAQSIELCGDPTDWQPLAASRIAADRWEAVLTMIPGVHRLAVRIDDGAWQAPAGMPTAPDGFGGEIGLVVVE